MAIDMNDLFDVKRQICVGRDLKRDCDFICI
jgi:hypothetical protein